MVAPLAVDLSYTAVKYEDEAEDDFRVDFNLYGYLHSQDDEDVRDTVTAPIIACMAIIEHLLLSLWWWEQFLLTSVINFYRMISENLGIQGPACLCT